MTECKNFELTTFKLKMIAMFCMTLDHAAIIFNSFIPASVFSCMRLVGRCAFPILAFMLTEGFYYTKNKWIYLGRLSVFAVLSMYPYYLLQGDPWNVLLTLSVAFSCLMIRDKLFALTSDKYRMEVFFGFFLAVTFLSWFCNFMDWGFPGIMVIVFAYEIADKKKRIYFIPIALFVGCVIEAFIKNTLSVDSLIFYSGILFSIPVLCLYNGKRGYSSFISKYSFYLYYPLHILILIFLYVCVSSSVLLN